MTRWPSRDDRLISWRLLDTAGKWFRGDFLGGTLDVQLLPEEGRWDLRWVMMGGAYLDLGATRRGVSAYAAMRECERRAIAEARAELRRLGTNRSGGL